MAISKDKKNTLVADLTKLLSEAKLTAYANYQGLSVAELEELRHYDVDEYLLSLSDAIICYGFDKRMEFYNETGETLQLMYDQVLEWVEAQ